MNLNTFANADHSLYLVSQTAFHPSGTFGGGGPGGGASAISVLPNGQRKV